MNKISVIVPVYNVEKYLDQCIESIINQTYKNLEIILVDDGSTDNSHNICNTYLSKENRIKVMHKKNGGLSDARNAGLKIATGDFISFVDSDDWLELEMYDLMIQSMEVYNADIVSCNINYAYEDSIKPKYNENKIQMFNTENAMKELIQDGLVQEVVWNKLYKKDLLEGIEFEKGKLNEDEFFTYKIIERAKKIVYIPQGLYYYRQRQGSIMSIYSIKRLDAIDALYERMNFIKEKFPDLYYVEKKNFCNACIYHYQMILKNLDIDKSKEGRNKLLEYRKEVVFKLKDLKLYNTKDIIYIFISKISLKNCCKIKNQLKIGM